MAEYLDRATEDLAGLFKVLGDPTRVRILMALEKGPMLASDIAKELGMSPSAISHQMRTLKQARLVRSRKDGRTVEYAMDDDHVHNLFRQGMDHVRESEPSHAHSPSS